MKTNLPSALATLKPVLPFLAALLAATANAQYFRGLGGDNETTTLLTIKSDGSSVVKTETVQPRKSLEMQIESWQKVKDMQDQFEIDDEEPVEKPAQPARKALSDEELTAKIREMYEERSDHISGEQATLQEVAVSSNSVRIVLSRAFGSLKELLEESPYTWGPNVLMFQEARLELESAGNLKLTFSPTRDSTRYLKNAMRGWSASRVKHEWKLVMPGKILSSGLPETKDTSTWLSLDGSKPASVEAVSKLAGSPLLITAEAAGLKLDGPLESGKLQRAAWARKKTDPDLPITEAGPGFQTEPLNLALTTVHNFPAGEKYAKERRGGFAFGPGSGQPGTAVTAKLFPPKGREIRQVTDIKVKSAKDDQGRAVPLKPPSAQPGTDAGDPDEQEWEPDMQREFQAYDSGDERGGAIQIEVRLGLPAPDAKAIDEIQAEAVATTIAGWKDLVITNVQADAKKEIDLGALVPGATMIVKKASAKKQQKSAQVTVQGPGAVNQLEVKIKMSNRESNSHMSDMGSRTVGGKTTRSLNIQGYDFREEESDGPEALDLIVRLPQDTKRERLQFKLTTLDLL